MTRRNGFTLIELLVVMAIIGVLIGLSFPFLRGMVRTSNVQVAANTVEAAVSGARVYATRPLDSFNKQLPRMGGPYSTAQNNGDGDSGAAVVITPANDLRIVTNDPEALAPNGRPLEQYPMGAQFRIFNGYKHIGEHEDPNLTEPAQQIDDLRVPGDVVLLGIVRTPDNNLQLLPPPFAIRFDARGVLVVRSASPSFSIDQTDRWVIYDADGDWRYALQRGRDNFSGDYADYGRGGTRVMDNGRAELPWDRLDPVIGVVVVDPREVPQITERPAGDAHKAFTTAESTAILERAAGTGQVLFFNRYTGQNVAQ